MNLEHEIIKRDALSEVFKRGLKFCEENPRAKAIELLYYLTTNEHDEKN